MNVICWYSGNPPIYRFWKDDPQQKDSSAPNAGTAQMVETTAYALLTCLSLKEMNYVNPIIKWLSEEQRYGGGFYSTQVTFLCLVWSPGDIFTASHTSHSILILASMLFFCPTKEYPIS